MFAAVVLLEFVVATLWRHSPSLEAVVESWAPRRVCTLENLDLLVIGGLLLLFVVFVASFLLLRFFDSGLLLVLILLKSPSQVTGVGLERRDEVRSHFQLARFL